MEVGFSKGTLEDNCCTGWSGGLKLLSYGRKGSEVSVDPAGNVFPCCLKTKKALGNLREETLEGIVRRCAGDAVYEAISMGRPERMGLQAGWSEEKFREKSARVLPDGRIYRNLCLGCDTFHEEVLMADGARLVQFG